MFRWGLLVLGLYLLFFAEPESKHLPGPVGEGSLSVQPEDILELEDGRRVTLEAELDLSRRAYPLDLAVPAFAPCPPRGAPRVLERSSSPADLDPLIGCPVEVRARLAPDVLVLEGPRVAGGETRLLAPVVGWKEALWALSPPAADGAAARRTSWMHAEVFTGRLTRFEDIGENFPELGTGAESIASTFRDEFEKEVPPEALLIVSEPPPEGAFPPGRPAVFYAPVLGSRNALLVRVAPGREGSGRGRITGRVAVRWEDELSGLARSLGEPVPPRLTFLEPVRERSHEAAKSPAPWSGHRLALALLGASGALFLRRYLWIRREKGAIAREIEASLTD